MSIIVVNTHRQIKHRKSEHTTLTIGTCELPNMLRRTAKQRPMTMSSLMFSMMLAASPATSDKSTGARYKFQKRKSSPRLDVDNGTWPNKLMCGSQKILSKHNTIYSWSQHNQRAMLF